MKPFESVVVGTILVLVLVVSYVLEVGPFEKI